jgi:hypothetical protein
LSKIKIIREDASESTTNPAIAVTVTHLGVVFRLMDSACTSLLTPKD